MTTAATVSESNELLEIVAKLLNSKFKKIAHLRYFVFKKVSRKSENSPRRVNRFAEVCKVIRNGWKNKKKENERNLPFIVCVKATTRLSANHDLFYVFQYCHDKLFYE